MNSKEAIDRALLSLIGTEDLVEAWWKSPNKAFDGKTPTEVWTRDKDSVRMYIIKQMKW